MFGSRFLKICFLDIFFSRVHSLIVHIQAREGSSLDGEWQKISASRFLTFWFLYTGFYCIGISLECFYNAVRL